MRGIKIILLTVLIFGLAASNSFGQGVMDLLERLEKVEKQLKWYKAELTKLQNQSKATVSEPADLTLYDEAILELVVDLTALETRLDNALENQGTMYADLNMQMGSLQTTANVPDKKSRPQSPTRVHFRMYSHGMYDASDDADVSSEFAISRAYLTLKSKIADYASVRITTDLRTIDDKYDIILKYAYLDWTPGFSQGHLKSRIGLQATQYIDQMNKLWGRRYLAKTVGDANKFLTSSDLGLSATVGFGKKSKYGFVNLALLNGTSYSHVAEMNSRKDFNLVAQAKPFANMSALKKSAMMVQFYTGTQNEEIPDSITASDWKRQIVSVGGLLAYNSIFDLGFDLNFSTKGAGPGSDDYKTSGMSFFGSFYLKKIVTNSSWFSTLNFFSRLDMYDPNKKNADDAENMMIVGIECVPIKGFKTSLNYRSVSFDDSDSSSENRLYLNTLVKF